MTQDARLKLAVLSELEWEPSVTAAHVGVTAVNGVITLNGHVGSFAEKVGAEEAAWRVDGVQAVVMELDVALPFDHTRGDAEIAAAAIDRLAWDVSIPRDAVKIEIEKGWITLTGQVEWFYQREAARSDVSRLFGVVGVTNKIAIKPSMDTTKIAENIRHALHRSYLYDPNKIKVTAEAGRIHLTGTVATWRDRQLATQIAWSGQGVTTVDNDIQIA